VKGKEFGRPRSWRAAPPGSRRDYGTEAARGGEFCRDHPRRRWAGRGGSYPRPRGLVGRAAAEDEIGRSHDASRGGGEKRGAEAHGSIFTTGSARPGARLPTRGPQPGTATGRGELGRAASLSWRTPARPGPVDGWAGNAGGTLTGRKGPTHGPWGGLTRSLPRPPSKNIEGKNLLCPLGRCGIRPLPPSRSDGHPKNTTELVFPKQGRRLPRRCKPRRPASVQSTGRPVSSLERQAPSAGQACSSPEGPGRTRWTGRSPPERSFLP